MSDHDHVEKTHPVAGAIFALVMSVILFLIVTAMAGGSDKALLAAPFLLLAAFYGVFALGADKGQPAHAHEHH